MAPQRPATQSAAWGWGNRAAAQAKYESLWGDHLGSETGGDPDEDRRIPITLTLSVLTSERDIAYRTSHVILNPLVDDTMRHISCQCDPAASQSVIDCATCKIKINGPRGAYSYRRKDGKAAFIAGWMLHVTSKVAHQLFSRGERISRPSDPPRVRIDIPDHLITPNINPQAELALENPDDWHLAPPHDDRVTRWVYIRRPMPLICTPQQLLDLAALLIPLDEIEGEIVPDSYRPAEEIHYYVRVKMLRNTPLPSSYIPFSTKKHGTYRFTFNTRGPRRAPPAGPPGSGIGSWYDVMHPPNPPRGTYDTVPGPAGGFPRPAWGAPGPAWAAPGPPGGARNYLYAARNGPPAPGKATQPPPELTAPSHVTQPPPEKTAPAHVTQPPPHDSGDTVATDLAPTEGGGPSPPAVEPTPPAVPPAPPVAAPAPPATATEAPEPTIPDLNTTPPKAPRPRSPPRSSPGRSVPALPRREPPRPAPLGTGSSRPRDVPEAGSTPDRAELDRANAPARQRGASSSARQLFPTPQTPSTDGVMEE
jgi:hypothetical protein